MNAWFAVVVLLTLGTIGMAVWMWVSAWQERGTPNKTRDCAEGELLVNGFCIR